MREILFRGKRIDNGDWVYGFLVDAKHIGDWIEAEPVHPETVAQFTGKTVKNGRVFEGDIGKSIDGIFLVCWDEEKSAFVMRFLEYPFETLYLEEMWDDAEIIGNIDDNPELLTKNSAIDSPSDNP